MPQWDVVDEAIIDADVTGVFRTIRDVNNWSKWWMPRLEARIRGTETIAEVGVQFDVAAYGIKKGTFAVRVTEIVENERMSVEYFEGDFLGKGEWSFEPVDGKTRVRLRWMARSNNLLITLLSPFISVPKVHSNIMKFGFQGLNKYLTSGG